jgi:ADP-heptose:LPS heptosyltransferase
MAAIRRHHAGDRVTLLTTAPFRDFAAAAPWFDEILIDHRPPLTDPRGLLALRRMLRQGGFDRVYDLQTSGRSSWYFQLLRPGRRPEWSGIARGASHPHADPERDRQHTMDRQRDQLAAAGIALVPAPDLGWAAADTSGFGLAKRHALIVPGAAAHRPGKRWPIERFAEIARRFAADFIQPVVLGGATEHDLARPILQAAPEALDLIGRTSLLELASLGRSALAAVGNDTGPMHLLAQVGTPVTVLFSAESDPALTAPRGRAVTILARDSLAALTVPEVAASLRLR